MPKSVVRFLKYSSIGVPTFLLDLAMLYTAVSIFGVPYFVATPFCFMAVVTVSYMLSRRFVFRNTKRGWRAGYINFALLAIGGGIITTALVSGLVEYAGLHYLLARICVAGVVGLGNYLSNLHFNFKVAGLH